MAITVTPLLTSVDSCEDDALWSGNPDLDSDVVRHGTYCLGDKVSNTTNDYLFDNVTAVDLTGSHFYIWMLVSTIGLMATKAAGGMRIKLGTTTSDYKTWYVDGKDTYKGGWQCYVVDPASTANATLGTFDITSVRYFGVEFSVPNSTTGNNSNCFWDQCWYGTGLQITSLTSDNISFEDIFTVDDTNAYGIVNKINGAYFVQGELLFGSTASGSVNITSESQVVAFTDRLTDDSLYKIAAYGTASTTTNINLLGNFFTSVGDSYLVDLDNDNLDTVDISGSTFQNANYINFNSSVGIASTVFDNCYTIYPSGATLENCVIKNSATSSAFIWDDTATISGCSFNDNIYGVEITTAGTYEFNSLYFNDNTYDILNSSTGSVIINVINGGSVTTATNSNGGSVTINNGIQFKLTGLISNTEVRIYDESDMSELSGIENSSTTFVYSYNYTGDKTVTVMIHNIGYVTIRITGLVLSNKNLTIPIQQQLDRWFKNP